MTLVLYPLFVHLYLELVYKGLESEGKFFYCLKLFSGEFLKNEGKGEVAVFRAKHWDPRNS